ncbi:hypothetical protein B9Z55_003494 [Caenorhabditis nigoni]|uniref:Uncharacterized protein n=1 Tax=Caenorhabditis nigoni TaxID=1611254 RepID=A0A2G5VQN0_9PELO|nr:hypothetical protein B9Z55_003494 [Caenorhabditis nigoni]
MDFCNFITSSPTSQRQEASLQWNQPKMSENELNEIADEALKVVCQYLSVLDMKASRITVSRNMSTRTLLSGEVLLESRRHQNCVPMVKGSY